MKTAQLARGCALLAVALSAACEGPPARSKPWRHASAADTATAAEPTDAGPDARDLARERADRARARAHTLRIRLDADPTSLSPLLDPDREALEVVEDTIFETLVRHNPDDSVTPLLAESYRVAGSEIRFALRRDVLFSDGKPFTALDAQKAIDSARGKGSRSPRLRAVLSAVVAAEVWGPRDLRIVLARPDAYALRALAEVPMVPAHLSAAALQHAPVGTGPYRLASWTPGERLRLERHERYWGRQPAIPSIEFVVEPDGARALIMAKRGDLDILPALIPEHWPDQAEAPDVRAAFAPLALAPARFQALALNQRRPPFDDARVRAAAGLLVDRARLARDTWRGLARPVAGPVFPGGPGDAPAPPAPYDPVRGLLLLEQAGWKLDKDGLRSREGTHLHMQLLTTRAAGDKQEDAVLTALRRAGFTVDVRRQAPVDLLATVRAGDFDAADLDYRGRVDEDICPFFATGASRNFGGLSSHAVDSACAAARAAWDPALRRAAVSTLAALVAAEAPQLPLVAPAPQGLVARRVRGLVVHDGWFAIRDLDLEAEKLDGEARVVP